MVSEMPGGGPPDGAGERVQGPPVVYLPVRLGADGEPREIATVRLEDGRIALLGYSALDRLVAACGEDQPWVLVGPDALALLDVEQPHDVRLLDVAIPPEQRDRLLREG